MRLAAYCRVSTDHEEQLDSLENQKIFFEDFANIHKHELVRIYADEGISGKQLKKRDQFKKMLEDAETGVFEGVLVKDIARFARNTLDFLTAIRELKRHNVIVLFVTNNMNTYGDSEFTLTIFGAIAQEESINISKRVRFGKKINAKKGRVPNSVYGYIRKDLFTLQIEPEEALVVRRIFQLTQEGYSMRRIAATLNEEHIPTKRGCIWEERNIRRLLINPVYKGVLFNHKSETKDVLEGTRTELPREEWYAHTRPDCKIIEPDLFDAVQIELERRKALHERQTNVSVVRQHHSNRHLFSNLLRCSICGSSFVRKRYHRKNGTREYWVCRQRDQGICRTDGSRCMNQSHIDETALMHFLQVYFAQAIPDFEAFLREVHSAYQGQRRKAASQKDRFHQLRSESLRLEKVREREILLYTNSLIELDEFKLRQEINKTELNKVQKELAKFNLQHSEMNDKEEAHWLDQTTRAILRLEEMTNEGLKKLIDRIVISKDTCAALYIKGQDNAVAVENTGNLNQHQRKSKKV